jgi:hypothetical protein
MYNTCACMQERERAVPGFVACPLQSPPRRKIGNQEAGHAPPAPAHLTSQLPSQTQQCRRALHTHPLTRSCSHGSNDKAWPATPTISAGDEQQAPAGCVFPWHHLAHTLHTPVKRRSQVSRHQHPANHGHHKQTAHAPFLLLLVQRSPPAMPLLLYHHSQLLSFDPVNTLVNNKFPCTQ